ncbi:serine hydrolase domain-containing protein [Vreelandella titanicae]|uniref:serine hydrolase domain-containing protein n=1 Tax=Vreelandella titanicae TaxID=664683 RepID=UPI003804C8BE
MSISKNTSKNNAICLAAIASLASTACLASSLQENSEQENGEQWVTETMINARANMFNPDLNFLTFQQLDKMFATRRVAASSTPWPLESELIEIDDNFSFEGNDVSLEEYLENTKTNALLVIKDGKIAYEQYRNGFSDDSQHAVFSASKSILATLVGVAVEEGKIESLDDKVTKYLPELEGTGYSDVRVIDVLRMRSGVAWEEVYEFGGDTQLTEVHDNALVASNYRWCDYAIASSEPEYEPGERFNYATLDTSVLGCVLASVLDTTVAEYMSEKIWQPAGMEADGFWIMDGGDEFYGAGFNATLRDLGRFGLMMLNMGEANGTQVIPASWVTEATVSDPGYEHISEGASIGYQYQWWTFPDTDAYTAMGIYNQYIYIDPDKQTVIVKLSHTPDAKGWDDDNFAFFDKLSELVSE